MNITRIGNLDIILPSRPFFDFADGGALRKEINIDSYIDDLTSGKFKIRIVIPDHFERYTQDRSRPTINADFFIGMFEEFLENLRNNLFPSLKADGNRRKFSAVDSFDEKSALEIFQHIMGPTEETYAPFESFLSERIKFALIDSEGTITQIEFDEHGMLLDTGLDEHKANLICAFSSKYSKALDSMFLTDFKCREDFMSGNHQQFSTKERALDQS